MKYHIVEFLYQLCGKLGKLREKNELFGALLSQKRVRLAIFFILFLLSTQMNVPYIKFLKKCSAHFNHNAATLSGIRRSADFLQEVKSEGS